MAVFRMNIYLVLRILKITGTFSSTWPPDSSAGKLQLVVRDVAWVLAVLNSVGLLIPLVLGAYHYRHDVISMMKALSEFTALSEVFCSLILCRMQRSRLQSLLAKINSFVKTCEERERLVLQKYIDRYSNFFSFVGISYMAAAVTFSCGPLLLSTNLPAETWYPFSTETRHVTSVLYVFQVLAILQTGCCITVDFMLGMLFWFSAARLDMLGLEFENVASESQLRTCIKKHQDIIKFVEETQDAVQYLILKTNVTMGFAVICGAFPLLYHQPFFVISQFICMVIGGAQRLYVTAWPANDLKETSQEIVSSAYCATWVGKSRRLRSNLYIVMQRSRKPLLISMGGLLPALSLEYYASFLYTTLSYFTAMRTIIADNSPSKSF